MQSALSCFESEKPLSLAAFYVEILD